MTAPILPLDRHRLIELSSAGTVGAWMLFPDDVEARERWRANHIARQFISDVEMRLDIPAIDAVVTALEAFSNSDMANHWAERAPRGYGAGLIVYNGCVGIRRNERAPLERARAEVAEGIWGRRISASKHVNDAVWRKYRSVAALWAAYVHLDHEEAADDFPCEPIFLPNFLSLAEHFRKLAEGTIPPRRADPVLAPGVSVMLPEEILAAIPQTDFEVRLDCSDVNRNRA